MKRILFLLVTALCTASFGANTWFVDDDWYEKGGDGSSDAPYGTIQEAVDAKDTQPGDTILVRPGVYSNGVVSAATTGCYPCRLYVTKADLVIRSTGGRAVTHIVGKLDSTGEKGIGPEAVACVLLNQTGTFVLDGFTIRDGRTTATAGDTDLGGGVYSVKTAEASVKKNHLYDCTVENCCSRGRQVANVSLHRCLVTGNPYGFGFYPPVIYGCRLENCISVANAYDSDYSFGFGDSVVVNCVVVGHWKALTGSCTVKNSVLAMNQQNSADNDTSSTYENCVFTEPSATRHHDPVNCEFGALATNLFVATRMNDYRTLSGSPARNLADPKWLAELVPLPAGYVYKDYYGRVIDTAAVSIAAGVGQEVVTPVGGCNFFSGTGVRVEGVPAVAPKKSSWNAYAHATIWPTQWAVSAVDEENAPLWSVKDSVNDQQVRAVPDLKGNIWIVPAAPGTAKTFTVTLAEAVQVVGPEQTLQDAVDAADANLRTVVRCRPGRYATGGNGSSRVTVSKPIHFVSVEPDGAVLVGGDGANDDGLGEGAVRLINNGNDATAFSGFTLAGGRTVTAGDAMYGALVRGSKITLSDCFVTNVFSKEYLTYAPVKFERCRIVSCGADAGRPFSSHGVTLSACLVVAPRMARYTDLFGNAKVVNSTVVGDGGPEWYLCSADTADFCNSIVYNLDYRGRLRDTANVRNSLFWKSERGSMYVDCVGADPLFAAAAGGDYRVCVGSPALSCATTEPAYFLALASSDLEGNPVCRDGRTTAGAFVRPAANSVLVKDDGSLLAVSGGKLGSNVLSEGGCLTVGVAAGAARPVIGLAINGETNLFTTVESRTLTYDQAVAAGSLTVSAVLGTNWYANANTDPSKGVVGDDDANSGAQPAFPKRTLAGALAAAVAGDIVWAAPGRYDDGKMNVASKVMASRADVAAGVTLRSTDGAAKTFIVGASATAPDEYGCGTDAVRCAYLGAGARLEGFTLTGGRAQTTAPQADATYAGAAVAAADADAVVSDCVITDCAAPRYVIWQVVLERCRVVGNTAVESQLVRGGRLSNVLFAENKVNGAAMQYVNGMVNVTWHSSNVRESDGSAITGELDYHDESTPKLAAVNCLFFACQVSRAYATTNCVMTNPNVSQRDWDCNWRRITDMSKLRLDADYRPIIEEGNALVDAGTNLLVAATDASGAPRVMNGTIDIGALEADWRPVYAKLIGRGVTVTEVSPEVTRTAEGRVSLGGGSLTMTWAPGAVTSEIRFDVTGDGGLRLGHNGTVTDYAKGDGQVYRFKPADDSAQTFVFEGEAEILGIRREKGLVLIFR